MHIAHVQGIFSPEHGGPTQSLSNYCRGQVAAGHRVAVWTLEGYPGTSPARRLPLPVEMHVFPLAAPARLGRSPAMRRALAQVEPPDVYHLHGAWLRAMAYGANAARQQRRPYVLEVMGMYEDWALRQKWHQKRLVRWWFQDRVLREANCLHVNSQQEADDLRRLGFKAPVAVIPVGVDMEKIEDLKSEIRNQESAIEVQLKNHPFVLFLSRLHYKKGLDLLIRAWAAVKKSDVSGQRSEWLLAIAGTGSPEYVHECRQLAEQLGIAKQCLWLGHVDEWQKSWLYARAHCYVLPTNSENFGNTVAEALAHGTPVITTIHTPWADLEKHRCGWVVNNTVEALQPALMQALALDAASRRNMGAAGQKWVREAYSLKSVLNSVESVYHWVAAGGSPPDCVRLD